MTPASEDPSIILRFAIRNRVRRNDPSDESWPQSPRCAWTPPTVHARDVYLVLDEPLVGSFVFVERKRTARRLWVP